ncbi:MAG: hypothetical protein NXH70_06515 [Hyphomonas sp.]|nr:hypothetical protein [Hyphomonas sp.]
MSLLVVNSRAPGFDSPGVAEFALNISSLIQRARIGETPIAHLHQGASRAPLALRLPIGRFDPIFATRDLICEFPSALIEFLVHSPSKTIHLAGLIRRDQLISLSSILQKAGYEPSSRASVLMVFDREPVD